MSVWTGGGATVRTKDGVLEIEGTSNFAGQLYSSRDGYVTVACFPAGDVLLRHDSDWLVDVWVRQNAERYGVEITSDYVATDKDMPEDVREMRESDALARNDPPGRIY